MRERERDTSSESDGRRLFSSREERLGSSSSFWNFTRITRTRLIPGVCVINELGGDSTWNEITFGTISSESDGDTRRCSIRCERNGTFIYTRIHIHSADPLDRFQAPEFYFSTTTQIFEIINLRTPCPLNIAEPPRKSE